LIYPLNRSCRPAAEKVDGGLDDVQWECHLSWASANQKIHDQLLTLHYLFTKEWNRLGEDRTRAVERLPASLMRGGLAWFRVSFHRPPVDQSKILVVETL